MSNDRLTGPPPTANEATDQLGADTDVEGTVRGVPSDNTTLSSVLADLEARGFVVQFVPGEGGTIECTSCGVTSPVGDFAVADVRRLEGASDPDDMASVIAARCPNCSAAGTLVLTYGPMASAIDADVAAGIVHDPAMTSTDLATARLDLDAPGRSMFVEADDIEPNEPA